MGDRIMIRDGYPIPALNAKAYGIGTARSVPMKCYTQTVSCCIDCPHYINLNGTAKTAYCNHYNGPERILTRGEIWGPDVPPECPLEDI